LRSLGQAKYLINFDYVGNEQRRLLEPKHAFVAQQAPLLLPRRFERQKYLPWSRQAVAHLAEEVVVKSGFERSDLDGERG
jgi:hypothetical protein